MAEKREKLPRFTSPIGVYKYPKLTEPGQNYNKTGMEYAVGLILDKAAAKALRKDLATHLDAAITKGRQEYDALPLQTRKKIKFDGQDTIGTDLVDEATEKETGFVEIKFKRSAAGIYKKGPKTGQAWSVVLPVFDAKGVPLPKKVSVWGGSEGRITFEVRPYFVPATGKAGLSIDLIAAQVTKLVSSGNLSADSYGFGEVEGGFAYEPSADEDTATAAEAADEEEQDF